MTPSVLNTLSHSDCVAYLKAAGVPQDLLAAIPSEVDGAVLIECATPDKFGFSTADKLFWVHIDNQDACRRMAVVLDELVASHPDDLSPVSPIDSAAATTATTTNASTPTVTTDSHASSDQQQGQQHEYPSYTADAVSLHPFSMDSERSRERHIERKRERSRERETHTHTQTVSHVCRLL